MRVEIIIFTLAGLSFRPIELHRQPWALNGLSNPLRGQAGSAAYKAATLIPPPTVLKVFDPINQIQFLESLVLNYKTSLTSKH